MSFSLSSAFELGLGTEKGRQKKKAEEETEENSKQAAEPIWS